MPDTEAGLQRGEQARIARRRHDDIDEPVFARKRRDARMRREHGHMLQDFDAVGPEHRHEIAHALAAGQRDRIQAALTRKTEQRRSIRIRTKTSITGHPIHAGTALDQSLAEAVGSYTKRINRSRQLFLAILGHDLRNPLNCIRTGVHLVSEKNVDLYSFEKLSMIDRESEAMDNLIEDMMDYASTRLGRAITLNRKPVDLQKLCREVVDEFRMTHPQRTLHFHPRGDLTGNWDADRLRQVVSNLLDNAFQHGSPVRPVELSAASEGSTVVMSVHNEGAPIPPEGLPTLFDPLVRHTTTESSFRRAPGSVGLGLYIVREILNAMGGTIAATSTARQGTTFTVRIPR